VGAGVVIAAKSFIEFDAAATAAGAKFKDLDVTSDTYAASLDMIKSKAREVAAVTEYNAVDTAGALDKMAMAGLSSEQAMAMLMGTTNLATAAGLDLTTAVDIATDTMGAFRLTTDAAGNALDASGISQNMDMVADIFARSTNMFNTDMPQMFEAIKKGGPVFADAGQSMESFSALVGVMANSGIKGSDAGTTLKNVMLRLAGPTDKAQQLIDGLGISIKDSQGNYLDVIDIIGQFENATKDMGTAERAAAMSTIFGTRTVTGMNILMAEGADKLREYRTELENAGGAAGNIAGAMRDSIQNRIEVLKSALMELGFKFVEAFQQKGVSTIAKLTDAISNFDPTPIINGVTTAANVIMGLANVFWTFRTPILLVVGAMYAYKAIMIAAVLVSRGWAVVQGVIKAATFAVTLATHGQTAALALLKGGSVAAAIATKIFAIGAGIATGATTAWSVATGVLNALFVASPIGWIVLAVGALIAIIIICVKNWDAITAAVGRAWEWIKNIAALIWDNLVNAFHALVSVIQNNVEKVLAFITIFTGPFGFIISIVNELRNSWGDIVEAFQGEGIIGGLKKIGGVLLSAVLAPVQGLLECLTWIPGLGGKAAEGAAKIQAFRDQLKGTENADASAAAAVVPATVTANSASSASLSAQRRSGTTSAAMQPATAPMTTAEQITYTQRNQDSLGITVAAEPGTRAQVSRQPASPNISVVNGGSNRGGR
jgi:TP901 family phage tail tape measure protein